MTSRAAIGVVIATLLTTVPVFSQVQTAIPPPVSRVPTQGGGLSLDDAIARAVEQEPSLRAARIALEAARGQRVQAGLKPNPSVTFDHRGEPGGSDRQTAIGVEWPLDLFRRSGRVEVADRELAASELTLADRRRLLAADVRARYGDVLVAMREAVVLDDLIATTRRQHELMRARVEQGASPAIDRDLLEVELRRSESERLLQNARIDIALIALKRILGMDPGSALALGETLESRVQRDAGTRGDDSSAGVEQRADVLAAHARVGLAEARVGRAQAEGRFDITLFAGYMRMEAGFPQRGLAADGALVPIHGGFNYLSAGATVMLPLLDRKQGEVAAAKAERRAAAAEYDAARLSAAAELAAARAADLSAHEAVKLFAQNVRSLARQNLSVVTESYELGRVTVFEVLAERRRFVDIERGYTEALRAAYDARTALERASGGVR
jgi:outer membrane protein, heavy metal efflux system